MMNQSASFATAAMSRMIFVKMKGLRRIDHYRYRRNFAAALGHLMCVGGDIVTPRIVRRIIRRLRGKRLDN